jgi:copper transport protein
MLHEGIGMRVTKRLLQLIGLCFIVLITTQVSAHANLVRSEPPANASLDEPPEAIHIWFTEPLELSYSRINLLDANGDSIELPPGEINPADAKQLSVSLPALSNGIYTVSWRVVSAADGHPTEGSFAFGVGVLVNRPTANAEINETIPADGVLVRWLNLLSFALMIGSIGFVLFVWQPVASDAQPHIDHFLTWLVVAGWLGAGVTSVFMLLLQASISLDTSLLGALTHAQLGGFITSSTFGSLWLIRLALWGVGLFILIRSQQRRSLLLVLACGLGILLTHSLFSHASATPDTTAAVLGDWLHLLATALWIGGLVAFVLVLMQTHQHDTTLTARMVGYFSNYARVAVAALVIMGIYAMWVQVGLLDALLHTVYGRALLIKLVLFLPLLGIAAINLFATHRRLQAGQVVWVGRLRGLVSVELLLTVSILAAAGVMASSAPARGIQAQREAIATAEAATPQENDYFGMEIVNDQMIHLQIMPGYVGENTFVVSAYDENGTPIEDASRIRLRFDNLDQNLGQSELRPVYDPDLGTYTVEGSNLSTPGNWRIRMTIQRPGQFDLVTDFEAEIVPAPAPVQPAVDDSLPFLGRVIASSLTGLLLIGAGGFFILQSRPYRWLGSSGLAALCIVAGIVFLGTGVTTLLRGGTLVVKDAWARPAGKGMTGAVYMTFENNSTLAETLVASSTAIADSVELHETVIENEIARMIPIPELPIPAGRTTTIDPGGYHLMLINLHQDLAEGDTFPLTLHFASGQERTLDVHVQW